MVKKYIARIIILSLVLLSVAGCKQSDPPVIDDTTYYRDGDKLRFSGFDWTIKIYEDQKVGPGPNYFSGHEDDIFFDDNGYLHMRIATRANKWFSTEIVSDKVVGYGTYIFTIEGDMLNIPENIVLGLFTWDNNTFYTDANSEVDIEFSRWGDVNTNKTLKYSVQPLNFGPYYPERTMDIELTDDDILVIDLIAVSDKLIITTSTSKASNIATSAITPRSSRMFSNSLAMYPVSTSMMM